MKIRNAALLLMLCTQSISLNAETKKPTSRSLAKTIKKKIRSTNETICAASEFAIGAGMLFYLARLLPGTSQGPNGPIKYGTIHELKKGNKPLIAIYGMGTLAGTWALLNGLDGLNQKINFAKLSKKYFAAAKNSTKKMMSSFKNPTDKAHTKKS